MKRFRHRYISHRLNQVASILSIRFYCILTTTSFEVIGDDEYTDDDEFEAIDDDEFEAIDDDEFGAISL